MSRKILLPLISILFLLASAHAANWTLVNGDRISGKLVDEDEETIEIDNPHLGRLKISRSALKPEAPAAAAAGATSADKAASVGVPVGAKAALPRWKRKIEFAFGQNSGAKPKEDLAIRTEIDGRVGKDTYRATARILQSEVSDKPVSDRREADFRWRHDFTKRFFTQALTNYASDDLRSIDLSLEQQFGGGYRVIDEKRHKANVGVGAVVQYLERSGFEESTSLLGSMFQDYTYTLNSRLKLQQESNILVAEESSFTSLGGHSGISGAPRGGDFRLRMKAAVESKLTSQVSLNLRFEYDYDRSVPNPELRSDQRLSTSLGYVW